MPKLKSDDGYELVEYRGKIALAIGRGKARRRISTGTNDAGLARVVAQQIWQKLNAPASERVEDLWRLYLADRAKDGRDTTRQQNAWKRLGPFFGERLGHNISKADCRDYANLRRRQGAALGTARTELELLRACLNLRYGRGNTHVWTPPQSIPRDRYLSREELEKLLEHVNTPHVRLFIILAVTTGARMSALLELTWNQVDFKHRTINFNQPGREQTNKRRPEVPINGRALAAGGSRQGSADRPCDRMGRTAGEEHQEGNTEGGPAIRRCLLTPRLSSYGWCVDGSGRRAHAEDRTVPWPYLQSSDRAHLCQIQSELHEGCRCGS